MSKLFYRTHYAPGAKNPQHYETNTMPSMTVEGEARTIAELLQKEISGMPIGRREVQYMEVDDINEISRFYRPIVDRTDLDELKAHNSALSKQIEAFEAYKKEQDKIDPDQLKIFNDEAAEPKTPAE